MDITTHAGRCCGFRTIYGMGDDPFDLDDDNMEDEIDTVTPPALEDSFGGRWEYQNPGKKLFYGLAPKESKLDRLDRYLKYLDEMYPFGITEVIINFVQTEHWREPLEARGFVEVSSCYNSNSSNRIYVFHRCTDKEGAF